MKMLGKKDILLLISDKITSKDSNLSGNATCNKNYHTIVLKNSQENQTQQPIGTLDNSQLKLNLTPYKQETIDFGQSLPVERNQTQPLITSLTYDERVFKESVSLDSKIEDLRNNCFQFLHKNVADVNQEKAGVKNQLDVWEVFVYVLYTKFFKYFGNVHLYLLKTHWYTHFTTNIKALCKNYKQKNEGNSKFVMKDLISAKVFDFILGLMTIYGVLYHKEDIWASILQTTQYVIEELRNLLEILMGSPAGLKLNYALNHNLGIFFFYHISLWKAFVESIFTISSSILYGFVLLGSFGLSYQIAVCADVIMFLTFHVYCIYVYAARLYRVQICAISSLWRLFIGRKYNPLKNGVDSLQYSNNQLFVGTLGFTVLLFLLPTTLLYYVVFTLFRLVVLLMCKVMCEIARCLSTIHLYSRFLQVVGSPRVKGKICIHVTKNPENSTLKLHATLEPLQSHKNEVNYSQTDKNGKSLNEYFNNVCTGRLL